MNAVTSEGGTRMGGHTGAGPRNARMATEWIAGRDDGRTGLRDTCVCVNKDVRGAVHDTDANVRSSFLRRGAAVEQRGRLTSFQRAFGSSVVPQLGS